MHSLEREFSASYVHSVEVERELVLDVFDSGEETKPAALLVNAYGMSSALVEPLFRQLCRYYRVITWECRGLPGRWHGEGTDLGLKAHVRDIYAIAAHCRIDRIELAIGYCTGARVLLQLAVDRCTLLDRMVLLSGSYFFPGVRKTMFTGQVEQVLRAVVEQPELADTFCQTMRNWATDESGRGARFLGQNDAAIWALTQEPYRSPDALVRYARMCTTDTSVNDLQVAQRVVLPTLVVSGRRDRVVSWRAAESVASTLQKGRFVVYEDGDHYMPFLQPDWLAETCRSFAEEHA